MTQSCLDLDVFHPVVFIWECAKRAKGREGREGNVFCELLLAWPQND